MRYLGLEDSQEAPLGYEKYVWMSRRYSGGIEWCKKHKVDFSVIAENWETDEDMQNAGKYLMHVKKAVMDFAVTLLNEYHHTTFGINEWNIMLSEWVIMFIYAFYDKYLKLLKAEAMDQKFECDLYEVNADMAALDYTDYHNLVRTEDFCLYQYSQLYQEKCHCSNIKVRQFKKYKRAPIVYRKKTIGYYKILAYRTFIRGIKLLTRRQDEVVFQESYLPFDFLLDVMWSKPGRITNYVNDYHRFERRKQDVKVDYEWRSTEPTLPDIDDEFILLMCKLLKKNLPIAYVENLAFLQEKANKLYKFAQKPKAVFFANGGVSYDEVFKAYLMSIKHTGALFCDIQHGGNYGIERLPLMQNEYELCDYFYTWGWEINDLPCKCKPMPAAKLLDKRLQNVKTGRNILYVSYTFFRRDDCVLYNRSLFYDKERLKEIEFLKELSEPIKERLVVRLFPDDHGWHVKEEINKNVSGIIYDDEADFYLSLGKARLVVLMLWSTTILEALYVNKPILVLHCTSFPEDNALEDIRDLERTGILVRNWEDLGRRLNEIYQDIEVWWNEPERQSVVQRIRKKYTFMPRNAKELWANEILELTENSY